jgi:carboxypeptidase Taq
MNDLLAKYKEIALLGKIHSLMGWDTEVNMPPKGAASRGEQSALLTSISVDKWLDPEFKKLLNKAFSKKNLSLKEKAIVRNLKRASNIYYKIPKELLVKESKLTSKAFVTWAKSREENDFKSFAPYLEELLKISREVAEHLGYKDNPYDALLDLYEPGLTAKFCEDLFNRLTPELSHLSLELKSPKKPKLLRLPIESQKELAIFVLNQMGYDFSAGRMDVAPHPFETTLGRFDVRITNRYSDSSLEGLTGAMHEGGHALYEQGVNEKFEYTPLDHGVSLGIHESQSRFWENIIGRSSEFAKYIAPKYKLTQKDLYNLLNQVKPGMIRVDADEVTYNLHVALRFEIENDLINGKIKVQDLPEIWNSKMKKYLGITPKNNSEGLLQDVHWSHNSFGYFPTYTLGNLYSAQWRFYMQKELNIKKLVEKGDFKPILDWLRRNIHQYGSLYYPGELVKKVTGENLNPRYFLDYIKEKYQTSH